MNPGDWKEHLTPRKRDDLYEHLLAGGAKIRLLESFIDLNLGAVLWEGPLSAADIARKLVLQPFRARKWLNVLCLLGLIEKKLVRQGTDIIEEIYSLTSLARSLFEEKGRLPLYYGNKIAYWKKAASYNINEVLQGKDLPQIVKWPPQTIKQAKAFTAWMKMTADLVLDALQKAVDFRQFPTLLHVAGGDCAVTHRIAQRYPDMSVTLFNQPVFAYLARKEMEKEGNGVKVSVVEGDLEGDDNLPEGFSAVLWTRVFSDLPDDAVLHLMKKTRKSVGSDGRVIICETMLDGNEDFVLTCEFNYLFADDLKAGLFKSKKRYETLLTEAGFKVTDFWESRDEVMYSVITADPI